MRPHSKKKQYRKYTDVAEYNKFISALDSQTKSIKIIPTTISPEPTIKQLAEQLGNAYEKKYTSQFITGEHSNAQFTDINIYIPPFIEQPVRPIHKSPVPKTKHNITCKISNIDDLLHIINTYPDDDDKEYNIDIHILHQIAEPLTKLNNMIGLNTLKLNVVNQLLFYMQNLHSFEPDQADFLHTVIYGPPGTGKTEVAKIIAQIFAKMGILKKGTFKKVTRADLIAGYLGQTALKTKEVIKECIGGVLFIDEAYALGNADKQDMFSKECIDTLCEALSDHKADLMVIIDGYENELEQCFFNLNPGLQSRFVWRYNTDNYSAKELNQIFVKKINDAHWTVADTDSINEKWFETNKRSFKYYGRDMEVLLSKTKIAHSRRVFGLDKSIKKQITLEDLNAGFELYISNSKTENKTNKLINSMYC